MTKPHTPSLPSLRHPFCKDHWCRECLDDGLALAKYLRHMTGANQDHGGQYLEFLRSSSIQPTTPDGWWHPNAYEPDNVAAYLAHWDEMHHAA